MTAAQGLWSLSKAGNTEECPVGDGAVEVDGDAAQGVRRQGKIPFSLPQTTISPQDLPLANEKFTDLEPGKCSLQKSVSLQLRAEPGKGSTGV